MLLVPDAHGAPPRRAAAHARRPRRLVGPARPWLEVRGVVRPGAAGPARAGDSTLDTEDHLADAGPARRPGGAAPTCAPRLLAPLADLRPGDRREAHRDAAGLAAAPGPARRGRGRAVRAPADGALPDGPAARAVRRPARRPRDGARPGRRTWLRNHPIRRRRGAESLPDDSPRPRPEGARHHSGGIAS